MSEVSITPVDVVPDVAVVGGGLAGLATAIKTRLALPEQEVLLIQKSPPQANTHLAGLRFRAGVAGVRQNDSEEIADLLALRNDGVLLPQMQSFAVKAEEELTYWSQQPDFVEVNDKKEWFGPQWGSSNRAGRARGKSLLDWLAYRAGEVGVKFVDGEVTEILLDGSHVDSLVMRGINGSSGQLVAGQYVLAAGSVGGRLFHSTNKRITNSAHELAFKSGLSLVDSTVHMIHPFGNCDAAGRQRLGCFETDGIADVDVYLDGLSPQPKFDQETTSLLREHQAHYHFPAISRRFQEYGSVVMLRSQDGQKRFARVSHHYSSTGIATSDGVSVEGLDNLYAVGDASGLGFWTNHRERFPGFALLKCLIDADITTGHLVDNLTDFPAGGYYSTANSSVLPNRRSQMESEEKLRYINTDYLHRFIACDEVDVSGRAGIARGWVESLRETEQHQDTEAMCDISLAVASAHQALVSGVFSEPYEINRNTTLNGTL